MPGAAERTAALLLVGPQSWDGAVELGRRSGVWLLAPASRDPSCNCSPLAAAGGKQLQCSAATRFGKNMVSGIASEGVIGSMLIEQLSGC